MTIRRLLGVATFCFLTAAAARGDAATCGVAYQGGPVISNVEVVEVYWTSAVATAAQDVLPGFFTSVLQSSYMDWLSEYDTTGLTNGSNQFIGRGTFKTMATITPAATGMNLTQAQVSTELLAQITAGHLPMPSFDGGGRANTFYAVDFPPGYTLTDANGNRSCVSFCATWGQIQIGGKPVSFAMFPDITTGPCTGGCGTATNVADNITSVHSAILLNVVTDPLVASNGPLAWYSTSNAGNCEGNIADICDGMSATVGVYTVAKAWSDKQSTCVVGGPATAICTGALAASCRGCTPSDDGVGCAGATPTCDTAPMSTTYGLCVAGAPDGGAGDASLDGGAGETSPDVSGASDAADASGALDGAGGTAGTGDAATGGACVPGQQIACACVGGATSGVQACLTSGAGYGACQCPDAGRSDAAAPKASSGCGCRAGGSSGSSSFDWLSLGALASLVLARSRRRRS